MKAIPWVITISIGANVLLASWWLKGRPASAPAEMAPAPAMVASETPTKPEAPAALPEVEATVVAKAGISASSWKDLETADLKELVRRLRAAGCPEETVQDVILAEVSRRYAARTKALWPDRYEMQPFWKVQKDDGVANKKHRETWKQERELQKEKSALLVELLGVDPEKERRKAEGLSEHPDYYDFAGKFSFLPEDKREAAGKIAEEWEDKWQDFHRVNRGLYDAQYRTELRELEAQRLQALSAVLSPQELREYELRNSQLANQLNHDLRSLTVSREEYEAIFDVKKKYGDSIHNYGDIETKDARAQVEANQKAMQADLAAALGPEKGKEYRRSQDYSYQQLAQLTSRQELPADTATKVYDFKEVAEEAARQLRANTGLSAEERQEALNKIRDETQQAVQEALGGSYTNYLRRGGSWLNNLAPRQRPPR